MRYLLPLLLIASTASAADLTVEVRNVKSSNGALELALYQSPDQFLKPAPAIRVAVILGVTTVSFRNLPEGEYALALYHDANGNGRIDMDAQGMPTEEWAVSNDARGTTAPPTFADARFKLGPGTTRLQVTLR